MTFLLASGWTTLLYFGFFVRSKYRTVKPPYERFVLFAMAGMLSTIPAAYFNARVLNDTALNFFETPDIRMGVLGVFLAPGLGEEFWKMAAGLLVVSCLNRRSRPVQPAECVLGFAVVGMAFAVIENIWSYGDGGAAYLLLRGLIAVPLHTSMCMLHGVGCAAVLEKAPRLAALCVLSHNGAAARPLGCGEYLRQQCARDLAAAERDRGLHAGDQRVVRCAGAPSATARAFRVARSQARSSSSSTGTQRCGLATAANSAKP